MTINYEQVDNAIRNIIFTINALKTANNQLESEISRLSNCNGTAENPHNHSSEIASIRKTIDNNEEKIKKLDSICKGLTSFKDNVILKDSELAESINSPEKFAAYIAGVFSNGQIAINSKSDYDMFMNAKEFVEKEHIINEWNLATNEILKKRIDKLNENAEKQAEIYLKKTMPNYSKSDVEKLADSLKWDQNKIDYLADVCYEKSNEIHLEVDPMMMMAILFTEGTCSFNTNGEVLAGDGGHGVQIDYKKDCQIAVDLVGDKILSYVEYKESFKDVCEKNGLNSTVFQYINWELPIAGRSYPGVYAQSTNWGDVVSSIYGKITIENKTAESYSAMLDLKKTDGSGNCGKYIFVLKDDSIVAIKE